jgi:hypothetical protein
LKDSIEVHQRLPQDSLDRPPDEQTIEKTGQTGSRRVFDYQTVFTSRRNGLEVALVTSLGQSPLTTDVPDFPILLKLLQFHRQDAFPKEEADPNHHFVTGAVPSRGGGVLDANEVGPVLRPVLPVGDVGESLIDRKREDVTHFDANHGFRCIRCWRRGGMGDALRATSADCRGLASGGRVGWSGRTHETSPVQTR